MERQTTKARALLVHMHLSYAYMKGSTRVQLAKQNPCPEASSPRSMWKRSRRAFPCHERNAFKHAQSCKVADATMACLHRHSSLLPIQCKEMSLEHKHVTRAPACMT